MFWWLLVGIDKGQEDSAPFEPAMFVYLIRPNGE
jgi:hypothetical protein